jgi:hypothetical protein
MKDKFANMLFPRLRRLKHCRVAILPGQPAMRGLTMIGSICQPIRKEEQPDAVVVWMSEISMTAGHRQTFEMGLPGESIR